MDEKTVIGAGVGVVTGVGTGLARAAAPHLRGRGTGVINATAGFTNAATKALRSHKGIPGALAAGTAAVLGHGVVAATVVAAAPAVAAVAVVGGIGFGLGKLMEHIQDKQRG